MTYHVGLSSVEVPSFYAAARTAPGRGVLRVWSCSTLGVSSARLFFLTGTFSLTCPLVQALADRTSLVHCLFFSYTVFALMMSVYRLTGGGASRATTIGFGAGVGFGSTYADTKRAFEQLSATSSAPTSTTKSQGADATAVAADEVVVVKE